VSVGLHDNQHMTMKVQPSFQSEVHRIQIRHSSTADCEVQLTSHVVAGLITILSSFNTHLSH